MKYDTQILNKNVNDMHNNIKYSVTCVRMSDPFTLIKYQIITQLYTKHINSSCKLCKIEQGNDNIIYSMSK